MSPEPELPLIRTGNDRHQVVLRRNELLLRLDTLGDADADAAEGGRIRAEIIRLNWAITASRIGVPIGLRGASLRDATTAAAKAAQAFIEQDFTEGRCLVLSGPTGVGKTYAAVAALRAAVSLGARVGFAYFPALCNALLDPERRREARLRVQDPGLVVLDDFGAEYLKAGGFLDSLVEEIIWHREGDRLPTILTTNLTATQLKERLSERIVDRLRGAWGRVVELPGESLRRKETA